MSTKKTEKRRKAIADSYKKFEPCDPESALKRLILISWRDIGFEYAGLTETEQASLSPSEYRAVLVWAAPQVGGWVRARKEIGASSKVEAGEYGRITAVAPNNRHTSNPLDITAMFKNGREIKVSWDEVDW